MFLAGCFVFVTSSAGQEPSALTRQIETIDIGTVHSLPSPLLDVIGTVRPGERFTVYATSGPDWYKIDFHGKVGYIPRAITKLMPRAKPQPAKAVAEAKPEAVAVTPPVAAKPAEAKPQPKPRTKTAGPETKKTADRAPEPASTEPIDVAPLTEVTAEGVPVEVVAESKSHAIYWLIGGAALFVVLILVLIHFEHPEESPNEFLHHHPTH
jgi:uncharacterized protein YgiM (DUF1202 family)